MPGDIAVHPSNSNQIEFALNPQPRCPVVLLLDTSGSMAGPRIEALNAGLRRFSQELQADSLASTRLEIAVITFDTTVRVVQDFTAAEDFVPLVLTAQGSSDMGAGIEKALELIQTRKTTYVQNGVPYYRPWVFMISDGNPTSSYERAAKSVIEAEQKKQITFFAVGVGQQANMKRLSEIAVRSPKKIESLDFRSLFLWLSASLRAVSYSSPGEHVELPPTSSWELI